jgi:hypothetical protein
MRGAGMVRVGTIQTFSGLALAAGSDVLSDIMSNQRSPEAI